MVGEETKLLLPFFCALPGPSKRLGAGAPFAPAGSAELPTRAGGVGTRRPRPFLHFTMAAEWK